MQSTVQRVRRFILVILSSLFGIFLAALGIKGFLLPNHFIDGGVTGISMLVSDVVGVELSLMILLINIPFVLMGVRQISFRFALRSLVAIMVLAMVVHVVTFPILTTDKLLSAIFGGISLGAGIGFAFRGGAVLDGTEILAIVLSKRFGFKVGDVILVFNAVIFSVGAFFLGLEPALYSVLTYMAASKAIDFLVYGFALLGVTIISSKPAAVQDMIVSKLGLGVTVYSGKRGKTNVPQDILLCVCSRLEVPKIKALVVDLDEAAFITTHMITDSVGGVLKRRQHLQP